MKKHYVWKKTAAFIFALTVTACSLTIGSVLADDEAAEATAVETTEELSTPPSETTSEEVYEPVINKVKMRLENGFSSYSEENTGLYGVLLGDQSDLSYLWYIDPSITLDNSGFAIADLDGDGRDELVLGTIDEDGNGTIIDLYTQYEGNYYHIAAAGERVRFALTNRNTIVEEGSSGAASWSTVFYDIGKYSLEPSLGYSNDNGKHYVMDSYTANEEYSVGYDFTWKESDEEELSFAYQPIKFTAFSSIQEERVLIKANIEGFGQIIGSDDGSEPVFDEDYPIQSVAFNALTGKTVSLSAKADAEWEFVCWRDANSSESFSTDSNLEIEVTEPLDLIAVFRPVDISEDIIPENDLVKWAKNDYQDKTGESANAKITGWSDALYDITLNDDEGTALGTYTVDPYTGIGSDFRGDAVDLPQTGMSGVHKAVAGLAAVMAAGGYFLIKKSRKDY